MAPLNTTWAREWRRTITKASGRLSWHRSRSKAAQLIALRVGRKHNDWQPPGRVDLQCEGLRRYWRRTGAGYPADPIRDRRLRRAWWRHGRRSARRLRHGRTRAAEQHKAVRRRGRNAAGEREPRRLSGHRESLGGRGAAYLCAVDRRP